MNNNILRKELNNELLKFKNLLAPTTYAKFSRKINRSVKKDHMLKLLNELQDKKTFIKLQVERIKKETIKNKILKEKATLNKINIALEATKEQYKLYNEELQRQKQINKAKEKKEKK